MKVRKLQLEDISKQLGLSKTLISMVINGKGNQYGISKKTQATVIEAITRLNYAPNKFAKSLRVGKSYFVGLLVGNIANSFYSAIASSLEKQLWEEGYNLMVCSTEECPEREKQLVEMLVNQQGVDGLVVASCQEEPGFYQHPRFSHIPILFIDRVVPNVKASHVVTDNYGGSLDLVNYLIKKGCEKICTLAVTPTYLSTIAERVDGFKIAIGKAQLTGALNPLYQIRHNHTDEDVGLVLQQLRYKNFVPDAFYATNNTVAFALLKELSKPENNIFADAQVACFDDIEAFDLSLRRVVSVRQPAADIGRISAEKICDLITGKTGTPSNTILPSELIVR